MISDRRLMRLSIVLSLVGIAALFLLSQPQELRIAEIDDSMLGRHVSFRASVSSVSVTENATFLVLVDDASSINAVYFGTLEVNKYSNVTVSGKISLYKGRLEVILDSVQDDKELD